MISETKHEQKSITVSNDILFDLKLNGWIIAGIPAIFTLLYLIPFSNEQKLFLFILFTILLAGFILYDSIFLIKKLDYKGNWLKFGILSCLLGIFSGAVLWLFKREQNLQGNKKYLKNSKIAQIISPENKPIKNYKPGISKFVPLFYMVLFFVFWTPVLSGFKTSALSWVQDIPSWVENITESHGETEKINQAKNNRAYAKQMYINQYCSDICLNFVDITMRSFVENAEMAFRTYGRNSQHIRCQYLRAFNDFYRTTHSSCPTLLKCLNEEQEIRFGKMFSDCI